MMNRTWLLLNVALFVLAAITVGSVIGLPAKLRTQKEKTAEAIKGGAKASAASSDRGGRGTVRKPGGRSAASTGAHDTWPAIRRGSLPAIWQKTLFNKDRKEVLLSELEGAEDGQQEEKLPAPPNFELIGILEANSVKVAIIELKSQPVPQRRVGLRRPMQGQQMQSVRQTPQGQDASAKEGTFEPSFVTAHENDELRDTGFTVSGIDVAEHCVFLSKDGLDYKLALDRNSNNAAKRRDSQNAFAQTQKDKMRAAEASAAARQAQPNQAKPNQAQPNQMQPNQMQPNQMRSPQRPANVGQPPMPPGMVPRYNSPTAGGAQAVPATGVQQGGGMRQGRFRRTNGVQANGGNP